MYNIYRNARRAALFFLFCLLTALVGLPIRGALATAAHESAGFATVQAEQRADAAMPRSVATFATTWLLPTPGAPQRKTGWRAERSVWSAEKI